MTVNGLAEMLQRTRFRYCVNEDELQLGIADALAHGGIAYQREVVMGPHDRLDFLTGDGVCIEAKVSGSLGALTGQLFRYAKDERITGFVVVTTRSPHRGLPDAIQSKPVAVVHILPGIV